jgi:hypothetical protein
MVIKTLDKKAAVIRSLKPQTKMLPEYLMIRLSKPWTKKLPGWFYDDKVIKTSD